MATTMEKISVRRAIYKARLKKKIIVFCVCAAVFAVSFFPFYELVSSHFLAPVPIPAVTSVTVQVEGYVLKPGLYQIPAGSKVSDAINAAGGFSSGADKSSLNLTETVKHLKQIYVPGLLQPSPDPAGNNQEPLK